MLPDEFPDFYSMFSLDSSALWIIKPSASSRGRGIYLVDSMKKVPTDENCVVSRYLSSPLLINNLKFDLRIYVVVTSFLPLRIYIYHEGLARFATEEYQTGQN